jgi:hypothetical protein
MNTHIPDPWSRLVAAARRAPVRADEAGLNAQAGFATRVVARAGLRPGGGGLFGGVIFERIAARALGCACACALMMAAWASLPATAEASTTEAAASTEVYVDPVGVILEVVQS